MKDLTKVRVVHTNHERVKLQKEYKKHKGNRLI